MIAKRKAKKEAMQLAAELVHKEQEISDPREKKKIDSFVKRLIEHPIKTLKISEKRKHELVMKKAQHLANYLVKTAEKTPDGERKMELMDKAKKILEHPIKAMRKVGIRKQRAKFLKKVPLECKSWVRSGYGQKQILMQGAGKTGFIQNLAQIQNKKSSAKGYLTVGNPFQKDELRLLVRNEIDNQFASFKQEFLKMGEKFRQEIHGYDEDQYFVFPKKLFTSPGPDEELKKILLEFFESELTNNSKKKYQMFMDNIVYEFMEKKATKRAEKDKKKITSS